MSLVGDREPGRFRALAGDQFESAIPFVLHTGEPTMRAIHLVPAAIIAPFLVMYLARAVTGEPLSAVIVALLIFVTVTATFTSASASLGRRRRS